MTRRLRHLAPVLLAVLALALVLAFLVCRGSQPVPPHPIATVTPQPSLRPAPPMPPTPEMPGKG